MQRIVLHPRHGEQIVAAVALEDQEAHPLLDVTYRTKSARRTAGVRGQLHLSRRGPHRLGSRSLRRTRRKVHDADGVRPIEHVPRAIVLYIPDAVRQHGRKHAVQRTGRGSGIRPGARHDQIPRQRIDADAQSLLHVGHLGLRMKDSPHGAHQHEDAAHDHHRDRCRYQQLDHHGDQPGLARQSLAAGRTANPCHTHLNNQRVFRIGG